MLVGLPSTTRGLRRDASAYLRARLLLWNPRALFLMAGWLYLCVAVAFYLRALEQDMGFWQTLFAAAVWPIPVAYVLLGMLP